MTVVVSTKTNKELLPRASNIPLSYYQYPVTPSRYEGVLCRFLPLRSTSWRLQY